MPATEQTWRSLTRMHKIFGISSLVLLVSTIWMFAKDHDREWKDYQRTFRSMEVTQTRWQEELARAQRSQKEYNTLAAELLAAQSGRPARSHVDDFKQAVRLDIERRELPRDRQPTKQEDDRVDALVAEAVAPIDKAYEEIPEPPTGLKADEASAWRHTAKRKRDAFLKLLGTYIARAKFQEDKLLDDRKMKAGIFDAVKSELDLAIRDNVPTDDAEAKFDRVDEELRQLTADYQHAAAHHAKLKSVLEAITSDERRIREKLVASEKKLKDVEQGLEDRRAQWIEGPWLGKKWLEMPILDAFNSPLKIENLWTEGLTHKFYNFKPVLRYDRCTTCHQAMEKTFEDEPQYKPQDRLLFTLATPTTEQLAEIRGSDANKPLTLPEVYGLELAREGLLSADDVTVKYIRNGSRAIQATLAEDPASVNYVAREVVTKSVSAALAEDTQSPLFGLMVGDVIEEINGNKVLAADDARRMLLETVDWGQPQKLTIRRGYPNPYVTHPRLDLFVGSASPHKLQVMGCTVCHEGQGSATEFKWASHSPNTLKERSEWTKEHGWFDNHHWIYPMYPERFLEATCLKCHHEVVDLEPSERFPEPPAPTLMAGYNTLRRFGCYGCHEIVGFDGPSKRVGPDVRLEPNYYAAGLQLAHFAAQREAELTARAAALKQQVETAGESAPQPLKDELQATEGNLAVLRQAQEFGQELGSATWSVRARRRLKEIVDHDEYELAQYQDAVAAGKVVEKVYHPAFAPAAYETAMVLKDDETPGQFRKVGPSLRYVASKLDAAFLNDWIREPKHFRPSTMMPQFFELYSHITGETAAETKQMRTHTAQLEQVEIDGLRTYLLHYSQPFEPLANSPQAAMQPGDAEQGKQLFELNGCLACHSNHDFPGHGDQGPDLTGLGSKFVGEKGRAWLYGWIENPKRYNARTKMPVVPLKRPPVKEGEAMPEGDPIADVVEYLLSSKTNWQPLNTLGEPLAAAGTKDADRLDELALEYLNKAFFESEARIYLARGIPESRRSTLKGAEVELLVPEQKNVADQQPLSTEQKLRYIGARSVAKYGCFGCHDIPGFEGAKPIGTTLSDWGRKDPSRLAFEHIDHYAAHAHGAHPADGAGHAGDHAHSSGEADHGHEAAPPDSADEADEHADDFFAHELHHHTRIGFIHQKLNEPRSYDYKKTHTKPFNDRLRMPQFPLTHEQHEQVITFVLGLVADPPNQQFVYRAPPRQRAINEGRKVLDQFNCAGCHELEREKWEISMPEKWEKLNEPPAPAAFPFLFPHVTSSALIASSEPTRSGRMKAAIAGRVKRTPSGQLDAYAFDAEEGNYLPVGELEAKEFNPRSLGYKFELYEPALVGGYQFMPKDPLPTIPVEMLTRREAARGGDLAEYLLPRVIDLYNQRIAVEKGDEAWGWVPPTLVGEGNKVQPAWLHAFLLDPYPLRPAVFLNMPKFNMSPDEATKLVDYFAAKDSAVYPFEFEQRTRTAHLAAAAEKYKAAFEQLPPAEQMRFSGIRFDDVMRIVTSQSGCAKCHSIGDYVSQGDPQAKGPNLSQVYQRLRPEYARRWIAKPVYTLPYTSMPEYIKYNPNDPKQDGFLDALPDKSLVPVFNGTSSEQLDALVDLLMNLDKYAESKTSIAELVPPPPAVEETPATEEPPAEGEE